MKKRANASKRAVAELLSNSADNNKDVRGTEASETDKRAELKKDLFGGSHGFGASAKAEPVTDKSGAEASADIKKDQTDNNGASASAPRGRAVPVPPAARGVGQGETGRAAGSVPAQEPPRTRQTQSTTAPVRPSASADSKAAPAVKGASPVVSQGRSASDNTVSTASAATVTVAQTTQHKAAETQAARTRAAQMQTAQMQTVQAQETARAGQTAVAADTAAFQKPSENLGGKVNEKKGRAGKRITIAVAAVLSLLLVSAACITAYLYVNREEEFVPADVTAGVRGDTVEQENMLLSDTAAPYQTEERYNVKFTFYQKPEIVCTTPEITVGELMGKLGITVGEDNRCSMTSDSVLSADGTVDIQTVTYETVSKEEAIPYETEYVDVRTIPKGSTKVNVKGENGVKTYTYKCTLVNGVEESRELVSEAVTTKPKTRVMYRGVGGTVTSQGKTYNYSYYIDVKATVYNIVGTTASGLPTSTSVMAVDPRVIPLGSRCVVTGGSGDYGYRIAADTGGAIKGNKIDLWYPAGTFNGFGWRSTRVYILE